MSATKSIEIDDAVEKQISRLADLSGQSPSALANDILRSYADDETRFHAELEEDEERWQRYKKTGEGITLQEFRKKLQGLASDAAARSGHS